MVREAVDSNKNKGRLIGEKSWNKYNKNPQSKNWVRAVIGDKTATNTSRGRPTSTEELVQEAPGAPRMPGMKRDRVPPAVTCRNRGRNNSAANKT